MRIRQGSIGVDWDAKNLGPHVEVTARKAGGWNVAVVQSNGGVRLWQRNAGSMPQLRATLADAAAVLAKERKA